MQGLKARISIYFGICLLLLLGMLGCMPTLIKREDYGEKDKSERVIEKSPPAQGVSRDSRIPATDDTTAELGHRPALANVERALCDSAVMRSSKLASRSSAPALWESEPASANSVTPPSEDEIIAQLITESSVPIDDNQWVREQIRLFQTTERATFSLWMRRSGRYLRMIQGIFAEEGLPEDLAVLAMVESGFNPIAYSRARAAGMWQFIRSTGRWYGLRHTWWVDERRDPVKSTRAATRYLRDLRASFGDWRLVIAAYNCGAGRLRRALHQTKTHNLWRLRLPRETKHCVASFMAALLIMKRPDVFGFGDVKPETPLDSDTITVPECTDLRTVARCVSSSYEEIKALNPQLRRWCTPPNEEDYALRVPKGTGARFLEAYAKVPQSEKVRWRQYRVRWGDTLWEIAHHFRTSVQAIMDLNGLRSAHRIQAGRYLLIPFPYEDKGTVRVAAADVDPPDSSQRYIHWVRHGDTLDEIARRYGVQVQDIQRWNGLDPGSYLIHPGDRLTIWIRDTEQSATASNHREIFYTVRKGDTLWDIARTFGTSVRAIKRQNNIGARDRIFPGERLKIVR